MVYRLGCLSLPRNSVNRLTDQADLNIVDWAIELQLNQYAYTCQIWQIIKKKKIFLFSNSSSLNY